MQLRIMTKPQEGATYADLLGDQPASARHHGQFGHLPHAGHARADRRDRGRGTGPRRTPRLAATFADEYNGPFRSLDETADAFARVRAACEQADRKPDDLVYSAAQSLLIGRDEADLARKIEQTGPPRSAERDAGLVGTTGELADRIGRFAEVGASRMYLQLQDLADLDQLSLVAEQFDLSA